MIFTETTEILRSTQSIPDTTASQGLTQGWFFWSIDLKTNKS